MSSRSPSGDPQLLVVGRVGRPHGVRGEVYVDLVTDRSDRLDVGSRLRCRDSWVTVSRSRAVGSRWLVQFEGVDSREAAAALTSAELSAPPLSDDPDALWVHHLIGARVVEAGGTDRGVCVSVVDNPAADLLELESGALVPVTFVVDITVHVEADAVGRVITIEPPEGLFELFDGDPGPRSGA